MADLGTFLLNLDKYPDNRILLTQQPVALTSLIKIVNDYECEELEKYSVDGFYYLLEIDIIKEILQVWSFWRNSKKPTLNEMLMAIIYYSENDTYLPV